MKRHAYAVYIYLHTAMAKKFIGIDIQKNAVAAVVDGAGVPGLLRSGPVPEMSG